MKNEHRKFTRVPVDSIVMYEVMDYLKYKDRNLRSIETPISLDISVGGMRMKTQQNLPVSIYIKMIMFLQNSKKPVEIIGRVVWTKTDGKIFECGIEFIDFINRKKSEIEDHINAMSHPQKTRKKDR